MHSISRKGIQGLTAEVIRQSQSRGQTIRLVAECHKSGERIEASVKPIELPLSHPLARVNGAENRLLVQTEAGESIVVSGTGAGRWATTEAVMADLFDIRRQHPVEGLRELEVSVA